MILRDEKFSFLSLQVNYPKFAILFLILCGCFWNFSLLTQTLKNACGPGSTAEAGDQERRVSFA